MTSRYVSFSRVVTLSVAFSLLFCPIATAQAPANTVEAPRPALLGPQAFARLVQDSRVKADRVPLVTNRPRVDLRGQVLAAAMRETPSASTRISLQGQRSWVARHKVLTGILIGVGAFFGIILLCLAACEE